MNSSGGGENSRKKPHSFQKKKKKSSSTVNGNMNSINVPSGENFNHSVTATTSKPKTPAAPNQVKKVNNKRAAKRKREKLLEVSRKNSETPLSTASDSSTTRNLLNEMKINAEDHGEFSDTSTSLHGTDEYKELPMDALILNTETVERIIEQIETDIESETELSPNDSTDSDDEFGEEAMNAGCQRYFLEKSGPKCFNCGECGHILKDCPATSTVPCNLCGQLGHSRSNCPQEVCYNCSRPGHQSKACPAKRKRRVYDDDLCNRCGQPGHLSRECSMSWRGYVFCRDLPRSHSSFLEELRYLRKRCYNCASISHFGDDCPNRRRPNYSVFHIPDFDYLDRVILRLKPGSTSEKKPSSTLTIPSASASVKKEPNAKQRQADNFKKIVNQKPRNNDVEMQESNPQQPQQPHHPQQSQHPHQPHQQSHQNRKVFLESRGINPGSDDDHEEQGHRKVKGANPVSFVSYESSKVRVTTYNEEEDNFRKGSSNNKKSFGGSYRGGYKRNNNDK